MNNNQLREITDLLASDLRDRNKTLGYDNTRMNILTYLPKTDIVGNDNEAVVGKIASVLRNEISLYRNEFQAHLRSFIAKSMKYLETSTVGKTSYIIKPLELPEICLEAKELDLFQEPLKENPLTKVDVKEIPFFSFSLEDLATGKASLDKYIAKLFTVSDFTEENLKRYLTILTTVINPKECLYMAEDLVKTWFIAKYIESKRLNDTKMSKDLFTNLVWNIETYIYHAIAAYNLYLKNDRLFLTLDKNIVYVLKPVLDSCGDEIGITDAILGLAISNANKTYVADTQKGSILANKEKLIGIWEAYLKGNVEDPVRRYRRVKASYEVAFSEVYDSMVPSSRTYNKQNGDLTLLTNAVTDYLGGRTLSGSMEEIENVAIDIIAGILFGSTNYKKFIQIGSRYLDKDGKASVEDVLPMILVELVVDFLFGNIKQFSIK